MTTRSKPEIRLFIVVAAIAVTSGLLVASVALRDKNEIAEQKADVEVQKIVNTNWDPGKAHKLVESTDFYSTPLLDSPPPMKEFTYSDGQMERAMLVFLHPDSDLLADQTFNAIREIVTNEQLLESKLIAKEYDLRMKDVRRERALILENAGISIDDPTEALKENLVKAFNLFSEVRARIFQEVLSGEQREAITQKYWKEIQAERENAKQKREEKRELERQQKANETN